MTASGRSRYRKQSLEFALAASGRSRYRKQSLEFAMTASGRSRYRKQSGIGYDSEAVTENSPEFAMTASERSRYRKQSPGIGYDCERAKPLPTTVPGICLIASGRSRFGNSLWNWL